MNLDPGQGQYINSVIVLPWTFKLLYGAIADNFPIMGSRRKNYVVLSGILQFLVLFALSSGFFQNLFAITAMLFINSLCTAFTDVVIDAIMVS